MLTGWAFADILSAKGRGQYHCEMSLKYPSDWGSLQRIGREQISAEEGQGGEPRN